jgi:potassium-transporting ATPase potassium-binding subunit
MSASAWMQLGAFLVVLLALAWPLARWIHAVMEGRVAGLARVEGALLRLAGVRAEAEQGWLRYTLGLVLFNALGVLAVYALQRLQHLLPLNPQGLGAVSPDSAFNTAVSFVTNTNWQGYGGETTMSYLTQMLALTVQNFLSAATGIAVVVAFVRGFARHTTQAIGNVWADLTRATLWVLLPLSLVFAVVLAGMGVVQTFKPYQDVTTVEVQHWQEPRLGADGQPLKGADGQPVMDDKSGQTQSIAVGPVASQLAIKMLGTNGGGLLQCQLGASL